MKLLALILAFAGYADTATAQTVRDTDGSTWRYVQGSAAKLDADAVAASWHVAVVNGTFRVVVVGCQKGKGRLSIRLGDQTKEEYWHYKGDSLVDNLGLNTCALK